MPKPSWHPERLAARGTVHRAQVGHGPRGAGPIFDTVIAVQVRGSLHARNNEVGGNAVARVGHGHVLDDLGAGARVAQVGRDDGRVDPERVDIQLPTDFRMPPAGLNIRWPDAALDMEARLLDYKLYAALAYCRANKLNHTVIDSPHARFGIVASLFGAGFS